MSPGIKPGVIVGFAIILSALAFGARAFVSNLTPYVSFADARRGGSVVQVMGTLDKTSIRSDSDKALLFTLRDPDGETMPVRFAQARPQNFEEAIEVTAIGRFDGNLLQADRLLVKCPSKYQGNETKEYGAGQAKPVGATASPTASPEDAAFDAAVRQVK